MRQIFHAAGVQESHHCGADEGIAVNIIELFGFLFCFVVGSDREIVSSSRNKVVADIAQRANSLFVMLDLGRESLSLCKETHCVIFFGAPIYETAIMINRAQQMAKIPLLMSLDAETGIGMRFEDATNFPCCRRAGIPSLRRR